jgi:hypothetical protein
MAEHHVSGGTHKRRREQEEQDARIAADGQPTISAIDSEPMFKRPRYEKILSLDMARHMDCVRLRKTSTETIAAVNIMKRLVLDGGVSIELGRMLVYPNYGPSIERALLDNLGLAVDWVLTMGFVPFFFRISPAQDQANRLAQLRRRREQAEGSAGGDDAMLLDPVGGDSDSDDDVFWNLNLAAEATHLYPRRPRKRTYRFEADGTEIRGKSESVDEDEGDVRQQEEEEEEEDGEGVLPVPSASLPEETYEELDAHGDLHFTVPSLNYGRYRVFLDTTDYRYKVDYIPTETEKDDPSFAWFVYTYEEPQLMPMEEASWNPSYIAVPMSPLSRLVVHDNALKGFRRDDIVATRLATAPILLTQERPPAKEAKGTLMGISSRLHPEVSDAGLMRGGLVGVGASDHGSTNAQAVYGLPHIITTTGGDKKVEQLDDPNLASGKPAQRRLVSTTVSELKSREYFIDPGRTFAGLMTPHSYPTVASRQADFLNMVSMEFGIPAHVLLPGQVRSQASALSGSSAGGKKQQASGAKQAQASQPGGGAAAKGSAPGAGGFTADPAFNKALELREFICSLFQAVYMAKNVDKIDRYLRLKPKKLTGDALMQQQLVAQLEEKLEEAKRAVVHFGDALKEQREQREEVKDAEREAHLESLQPPAIAKTPAGKDGGGGGKPVTIPTGPQNPPGPPVEPEGVPSAPEVQELTQQVLAARNDLAAISRAQQQVAEWSSVGWPVRVVFRQPFLTDTTQISAVIQQLGVDEDQGRMMAQHRLGLL